MISRRVRPILIALAVPLLLPHTGRAQAETPAADSLWTAGDMAGAASAYQAALADHPDDPRVVLRLGIALYRIERYDEAIPLLERAAEIHPAPAFAHWFLAQTYATTGRPAEAVAALRLATAGGGIPYPTVASNPAFESLAGNPDFEALMESIKPCTAPEYRQFDFWVGDWVVQNPAGQVAGMNTITREYDGCLLVEHWQGTGGGSGTSQNFYHKGDGKWHQNWIDSQAAGPLWLVGGLDAAGAMVLTDVDPATAPLNRVTWTPNPDGSVRQHWEQSGDGGETWGTVFDGLYVPRSRDSTP